MPIFRNFLGIPNLGNRKVHYGQSWRGYPGVDSTPQRISTNGAQPIHDKEMDAQKENVRGPSGHKHQHVRREWTRWDSPDRSQSSQSSPFRGDRASEVYSGNINSLSRENHLKSSGFYSHQ